MTTHALHQAVADRAIFNTLELVPTPSQQGQQQNDGKGNQPTHWSHSETKTAGPQLFIITKMRPNAGGDAFTIIDRTRGDALQACFNRIPGSSLLLLHGVPNRLEEL